MKLDFDTMNETDVREIVVRPLLHRHGYQHGTPANIRSEVHLRYDRAFLGRKQPRKDPPLAGRADYICDATSYGRWVVEVKAPQEVLSQDDVEQAHTYSAHPEISARYFPLTNGREFRLYATGQLDEPVLAWSYEELEEKLANLFNVLSYHRRRRNDFAHNTWAMTHDNPPQIFILRSSQLVRVLGALLEQPTVANAMIEVEEIDRYDSARFADARKEANEARHVIGLLQRYLVAVSAQPSTSMADFQAAEMLKMLNNVPSYAKASEELKPRRPGAS